MKAVIYARYSSDNQTEMSITGQIEVCTTFAKRNNIEIIDTYIDRAIPGKKESRLSFQKMIMDSKSHLFDLVIVYKLDRFARSRYISAVYRKQLELNNVKLYSATESVNDNSPENVILQSVLEGIAEYYSLNLSQNVKRGLSLLQREGKYTGGFVPLGFKIDSNKNYVLDPDTQKYVKDVFDMYINGATLTSIANYLNKNRILSPAKKKYDKKSIVRIIRCKKYIGVYKSGEYVIEDKIPSIVSKDTFMLANQKLGHTKNHKEKKNMSNYNLTGKLYCSCGSKMIGTAGTSATGKEYQYYKCSNCDFKPIRKDLLESFIVEQTTKSLGNEDILAEIAKQVFNMYKKQADDDSRLKLLNKQLNDINNSLDNLLKALEHGIFNETTQERMKQLENDKNALLIEIEKEKTKDPEITQDLIEFFLYDMLITNVDSNKIIDTFIKRININGDKIEIIYNCIDTYSKVRISSNWWG